ncbi:G patch domain-containing protein 4 isoform X1 [Drosophila subpulchrella]|uniref:G patch domain-containing protein 4 isoform X1 n=1 Tax=Drosophila subpulchrella TaxID=1486046 RepID=UPI0018A12742|nr:G patch domain-containing protein 4 isoform X1 [Drosophila subpulchrella]
MAMLAEPRRRKRYNLCPRGKALYEDENRFGTKMLEKMGWTKGNGLGAKQDGEKDFVRIRFKNDAEGLGFEARDDQWTTHEEGFNGLLKSLNGEENEANGKESEPEEEARPMGFGFKAEEPEEPSKKKLKENTSGMSLEERSKQSRARVHYKKFTRGKDLSQYSEKDLANIFGKKATDDIDAPAPVVALEEPKEEKIVDANFAGVQTVSTGLSVSDYFKQKMEAMKNRLMKGGEDSSTKDQDDTKANVHEEKLEETATENGQESSKKKKKKKDKERNVEPPVAEEEIEQSAPKTKKKKSKRSSQDETEPTETLCVEEKLVDIDESNPQKQKKKKKSKHQENTEDVTEIIEEPALKKKKSNGNKETAENSIGAEEKEERVPKKKKSKKTELVDSEVITIEDDLAKDTESITLDKTKETAENSIGSEEKERVPKKKSKKTELVDSEVIIIEDDLAKDTESKTLDEKASKRKRKSKIAEDANQQETVNTEINEETSTKKRKKSKEENKSVETDLIEQNETLPTESEANEKTSKKKRKSNNYVYPVPELRIPELALAVDAVVNKGGKHTNNVSAGSKSSGDKSDQSANLPNDLLSLEEIKEKLKLFNTCQISQFCAEKFQIFDLSAFKNSTLSEIVGYGTSDTIELEVTNNKGDERRILDLWNNKSLTEAMKSKRHARYPGTVKRNTLRAVKKRVAFQGI